MWAYSIHKKTSGVHPSPVCLSILSNNFSVEAFWQLFSICHRSITGLGGGGGVGATCSVFYSNRKSEKNLDTCRSGK